MSSLITKLPFSLKKIILPSGILVSVVTMKVQIFKIRVNVQVRVVLYSKI